VTHPLQDLHRFGSRPDLGETILRAGMARAGTHLSLRYVLGAPADRWRLPRPQRSEQRADRLWEHTCFEAFVAPAGGTAYWELNVAPGGDWNVYRFDRYRDGMQLETRTPPPEIRLERASCGTLTLHARLDAAAVTEWRTAPLEVGLAAVLESTDGVLSYWALAHAAAKPDFHRRASFLVRVGAEVTA
jgi:hypothetical protein